MWFLGLVVGAIIGAVGGTQGAILGALFGAGVGWAISQKPNAPSDSRLRLLESSIRPLQQTCCGSGENASGTRSDDGPAGPRFWRR